VVTPATASAHFHATIVAPAVAIHVLAGHVRPGLKPIIAPFIPCVGMHRNATQDGAHQHRKAQKQCQAPLKSVDFQHPKSLLNKFSRENIFD
jgi:hypothetical protein